MKVTLTVDNREKALISLLKVPFTLENLDVGDFLFRVDDELSVIIERKSLTDLGASIVDGRYREQKKRLLASGAAKILYLFEGRFDTYKGSVSSSTLYSAMVNCVLRDEIGILHSESVEHSAELIENIFKKLGQYKVGSGCKVSYQETVLHQRKNKNLDAKGCYVAQLTQIPGISNKSALAIAADLPSMSELIDTLEANPEYLREFKVNGKRLGVKGDKVYQYLFQLDG